MERDFIQYLSNKINADIERMKEDLSLGKAENHGDYKWACGIVRGLMMANGLLQEAVQEAENDDG